jgi:hypothetical protein
MAVGRVVLALCACLLAARSNGQQLTSVQTVNLPTIGGAVITISGAALGGTDRSPTVYIGATIAATTSYISFSNVWARTSPGHGTAHTVRYVAASGGIDISLNIAVSYDSPLITNLLGQNGPPSGSSTLTVTGMNFGWDNRSPTITVGGSPCLTTSWFSDSSLRCRPVAGSGGLDYVTAELATVIGSTTRTFSYDAPVVTFSTSVNTAPTAGFSVTISGINFAGQNLSPTATIGPFSCTTASWVTSTSLTCQQPYGAGAGLAIGANVAGRLNTGYSFSYDSPVTSFIVQANSAAAGGAPITLFGLSFGGVDVSLTAGAVSIGGSSCLTVSWSSATQLQCLTGTGLSSAALDVITTINGAAHSRTSAFTYDPPVVSFAAALNSPVTAGTTITLAGMNFRLSDTTSTALIGSTACVTTSFRSDTSLVCAVPAGQPTLTSNTNVLVGGVIGTGLQIFTYDSPVLTSSRPWNGASSQGTRVTVNGFNFGAMDYTLTVSLTGSDGFFPENCRTVAWVSDNELQCVAAGGEGASISVYLTTAGVQFRAPNVFTFDSPVVTFFGAVNGPTSTGASLTLNGFNFGKFNRSPNVLVGATLCQTTAWTTSTQLTCLTPTGTAEKQTLRVNVRELVYTVTNAFSFDAPVLTQFAQPNGAVSAGTTTTIYGFNFASDDRSATAKIGVTVCGTTSWSSATAVTCALAPWYPVPSEGIGTKLVTLTNSGQVGCKSGGFTYDLPALTNAQRANAPSTSSATISISGLNFGTVNISPTIRVGNTACLSSQWVAATALICVTPVGATSSLAVSVVFPDLVGSAGALFSFDTAVITRVLTTNAAATAGSTISLTGFNFGAVVYSGTAQIAATSCITTSWNSDTSVTCSVPQGFRHQLRIGFTTGATGQTLPIFSYDSPVVTRVAQPNLPTSSGASLTIFGLNFASSDGSPTVNVGVTQCGTVSWSTGTQVVCGANSLGWSRDHKAHVELGTLGTLVAAFTFDPPVLTATLPANQAATGNAGITILGLNFAAINFSPTVLVAGTTCLSTSWFSTTSIVCTGSPGTGAAKSLSLAVMSLVGSTLPSFTYDSAVVTFVNRMNGVVSGGTSITVSGVNFGASDPTVTVSTGQLGKTCTTTSWTTGTSLVCAVARVPQSVAEADSALSVTAVIESLVGTSFRAFTYDAPTVTRVVPANMPTTSGAVITVLGHNYGSADSVGNPSLSVSIGATPCATTVWAVETAVLCLSAAGTGPGLNAGVTFKGLTGQGLTFFTYDSPVITDATLNGPTSAGNTLTVRGFNMGAADTTLSLSLIPTLCSTTSWTSTTQVTCASAATALDANGRLAFDYSLQVSTTVGSLLDQFTFDGPIITNIRQPNAPPSSGATITVLGMNFVQPAGNPAVTIGTSACSATTFVTATSLTCVPSVGSGQLLTATTTLQQVVGTMLLAYSYDAPVITQVARFNAPTSSGTSITFSGMNFGQIDLTVSVIIGRTLCATSFWSSSSSVNCVTPDGKGAATEVAVIASTRRSQGGAAAAFFSFDAPIVTRYLLPNAPTRGGSTVSIMGTNFGPMVNLVASSGDPQPVAQIGDTSCSTTVWITGSLVICQSSAGVGASRTVTVTVERVVGSGTGVFSYDSPKITGVSAVNSAASGGAIVTLAGTNFGAQPGATGAVIELGLPCSTTSWRSDSSVLCTAPAGVGFGASFALAVQNVVGTVLKVFSFDAPVVTASSPNGPATGGAFVTVFGANFGASLTQSRTGQQGDQAVVVRTGQVGQSACSTVGWVSDTAVACQTVAGNGRNHKLFVAVASAIGTSREVFTFDSPTLTFVLKPNAPTSSGASISIFGSNFASLDSSPTIRVGKTICLTSSWISDSALLCRSPAGTGLDNPVAVTIRELVGSQNTIFTFNAPTVTFAFRFNAATSGGTVVTLNGHNFGYADVSGTASVGSTVCKKTQWVSTTAITCQTGAGIGQKDVSILIDGIAGKWYTSNGVVAKFSFDSPIITQTSSVRNGPATGGATIVLYGTNFGEQGDAKSGHVVIIGGAASSPGAVTWNSQTALTSVTPQGSGQSRAIAVTIESAIGTLPTAFTYDAPVITAALIPNSAVSGGATITIRGRNFGASNLSPTVRLGATQCATSTWASDIEVTCVTARGVGAGLGITLEASAVVGTGLKMFSYDAPVVTNIQPVNGPTAQLAQVTISGFNFGLEANAGIVLLGSTKCAISSYISENAMSCSTSAGQGSSTTAGLLLEGVTGQSVGIYTFDAPVLTHTINGNAPATGASLLTVLGINFGSDQNPVAQVGRTVCATTVWNSQSSLVCRVPAGYDSAAIQSTGVIQVDVGYKARMLTSIVASKFSYDSPQITLLTAPNTAVSGGGIISILGRNFGSENTSPALRIGQTDCITSSWRSDSLVTCRASPGIGGKQAVFANVGLRKGQSGGAFTFDAPVITISRTPNAPTAAATVVTFNGMNFGSTPSVVAARVGNTDCATAVWQSASAITCQVAQGYNDERGLSVGAYVQDPSTATLSDMQYSSQIFSYDAPLITYAVNTKTLPLSGGSSITLFGKNFGEVNTNPKAYVGPTACTATTWISSSAVVATTPKGGAAQGFAWDVNLVVGTGLGTKSNEAIYLTDQTISPFDTAGVQIVRSALADSTPCPCVTPPCGSVTCDIISPTQYLSCPADFNFDLLSQGQLTSDAANRALTFAALANSLTIVAKNGVTLTTNTDGLSAGTIAVSSTGTGILNQRLFSIKMGQFLPDALYTVTLQVSGDFQMTAGLSTYSDLYFGVGNGKNWIGVQKADPQGSVLTGSIVQGTYDDILTITGTGVELSKWPTPGISTPQVRPRLLNVSPGPRKMRQSLLRTLSYRAFFAAIESQRCWLTAIARLRALSCRVPP